MGIAWADYDGDGYLDLFIARHGTGTTSLYHNNGNDTFTTITNSPSQSRPDVWSTGAWADFGNNGRPDLLAVRNGPPAFLYYNNGDGTFTSSQFASVNPFSIAVADYDRDGLLDVLIPAYPAGPTALFHNNGDQTFTRMTTAKAGSLANATSFGGAAWADYDDDGWLEVYVANLNGNQNLMFHNDGTGRFVASSNLVTQTPQPALMGAWGDYDNDGRLDLCVACINGSSMIYHNLGNGQFERAAPGVSLGGANWANWVDYDNDGFLDLFMTYPTTRLFHNNGNGTFTNITTGSVVLDYANAYGGAWFDYDNDGFLDLYVLNGNDAGTANVANYFYHNNGNSNAWLKVRLVGTVSNRDAIGAKVRALATYAGAPRWQRRDITGGDWGNGNQLYADFGLGDATNVTALRIEWPSGTVEEFSNIVPRQYLTIVEPSLRGALAKDGKFHLSLTMSTNRVYQIQASSDLVTWTTLTNSTGSASYKPIEFVDPEAPSTHTARFYRMK